MNTNESPNNDEPEAFALRPLQPYYGWCFDRLWDSEDVKVKRRKAHWQSYCDKPHDESAVIDWYLGLKLHLYLGHDLSRQLYIAGCYEPNAFFALHQIIKPGMTVIDVGAHEGVFTLFCAQKVGQSGAVFAFEPSPRERKRLNSNIELNQLNQVQVSDLALADKKATERLKIAESTHSGQNTLGAFVHDGVREDSSIDIQTTSLDDFVSENSIESIDFIKLDAEGSEARILLGAKECIAKHRPAILLEYLPESLQKQGTDTQVILNQLKDLDYQFFQFAKDGL
ncbi:MAG: FkbM family methyltransferase, partial [Planctomycetota bacterium]|nr:FkbM family methyltransferase [Planctomycetota bacterium]